MDVKPLTTSKITNILSNDPFSKSCFIGVFPRDKLPELISYPACFVVNTDPSYKVGEHWLGMYFDRYRKCYFFDSFRNEPDYFKLDQFVNKNSVEVEFNYYQIQDFFSPTKELCSFFEWHHEDIFKTVIPKKQPECSN